MFSEELKRLVAEMRMHFLVPPSDEEVFRDFDAAAASTPPEVGQVVAAFRHNVTAALSTVAMPFVLANSSMHQ